MEEAVEDGGGDGGVTVEDGSPLFEGFVGGDDDRAAFVALADDLEEKIGPALVDGKITDLIEEQGRGEVRLSSDLSAPLVWAALKVLITSIELAKRTLCPAGRRRSRVPWRDEFCRGRPGPGRSRWLCHG